MDNFLLLPRSLAAALFDATFATAFGLTLSALWLERDRTLRSRLQRSTLFCAIAMLLALCAQSYLATANMIASAAFAEVRAQLPSVMSDTHAGRNLLATGAAVLALLMLLAIPRTRNHPWPILALLTAIAAVRSAGGHAAANGDFTLPEFVQFTHLTSIAIWAGGVIAAGLLVLPALLRIGLTGDILAFTRRLSRTVTFALLLVVLSGIYNACRGLGGSVQPLAHTQWGLLLDAKIILVLAAITMGALNRRTLQRNPTLSLQQASHLTALLRAEAIVMLLILTVSAFLANSPPAGAL